MSSTGKIVIPIVIALALSVIVLGAAFIGRAWFTLPFPILGLGEPPVQPIAFPHSSHVDVGGVDCVFCHRNVTSGQAATVPSVEQCMFCHKVIGQQAQQLDGISGDSGLLAVIGWDSKTLQATQPINWERVHRLPDHVQFNHEAHITYFTDTAYATSDRPAFDQPSQVCSTCHGDVATMPAVKQVRDLKMQDCVDCHRDNGAPTDCTTCHH